MCFSLIVTFLLSCITTSFADDLEEEVETDIQEVLEAASNVEEDITLNSRAAVIYDRTSGTILYGKNENQERPMASTTKIMTAILVIENGKLDDIVEVSKKAAGTGGSRLGLKTKDKISVKDLLYGLLLVSGNDAAVALAEYLGGDIEGFATLMNQKALELGLTHTHFVTPHGLDQKEHYTTAYELAKLADYAMNNETFAGIVGTKYYTVTMGGRTKSLSNTNELLGNLEGVNGVKTGFTNGANRCLVTSVKRGNMNIITVVLGADTKTMRTQDSVKLIEYAYQNYTMIDLKEKVEEAFSQWKENNLPTILIEKGKSNLQISLQEKKNYQYPIRKKNVEDIEIIIDNEEYLMAPIAKGTKIGTLKVLVNEKELFCIPLLVDNEIKKKRPLDYLYEIIANYPDLLKSAIN